MADGTAGEGEVCIRENGNDTDAVDAVDIGDNLL